MQCNVWVSDVCRAVRVAGKPEEDRFFIPSILPCCSPPLTSSPEAGKKNISLYLRAVVFVLFCFLIQTIPGHFLIFLLSINLYDSEKSKIHVTDCISHISFLFF